MGTNTAGIERLPARPLTSWLVYGIAAFATLFSWAVVIGWRDDPTEFAVDLVVSFFVPMVASALCIEVLVREGWGNQRVIDRKLYWVTFAGIPLGALTASTYLVTLMPASYRGNGIGIWFAHVFFVGIGVVMGTLLWSLVVFPLAMLAPSLGMAFRGKLPLQAVNGATLLFGIAGTASFASLAFDYSRGRAWGAALFSILGLPGDYYVESEVFAWIARVFALLILVVIVDAIVGGKRTSLGPDRFVRADAPPKSEPADAASSPSAKQPKQKKPRRRQRPSKPLPPEPSALDVYDNRPVLGDLPEGAPQPPARGTNDGESADS